MIDLFLTAKPLATFYLISRIVDWPLPSPSTAIAQARHHRLGQTGGKRRQRRLGGSSPGHASAIGAKDYTGRGICFPQTLHLAQAKVPDQSFSLPELRVSRHFSTFYGSSVQAMGIQLGSRHRRRVLVNRNFAACHCEGASTKARRTCTLTTAPSSPGGPIRGCRRPRSRVSRSARLASECR